MSIRMKNLARRRSTWKMPPSTPTPGLMASSGTSLRLDSVVLDKAVEGGTDLEGTRRCALVALDPVSLVVGRVEFFPFTATPDAAAFVTRAVKGATRRSTASGKRIEQVIVDKSSVFSTGDFRRACTRLRVEVVMATPAPLSKSTIQRLLQGRALAQETDRELLSSP